MNLSHIKIPKQKRVTYLKTVDPAKRARLIELVKQRRSIHDFFNMLVGDPDVIKAARKRQLKRNTEMFAEIGVSEKK